MIPLTVAAMAWLAFHFLFPKDPARNFLHHPPSGWSYLRGYCAGIGWAKADLKENRAFILVAGLPGAALDQETGLRNYGLDCVVDAGREGITEGYNQIVRSWIRVKGAPVYSRKKWEGILYNLTDYFDNNSRITSPVYFVVDGEPILGPDGLTKIFLKSRRRTDDTKYLITWEPDIEYSTWPLMPKDDALQYYPGPPGSELIFLRGFHANTREEATAAFDFRYGFYLRYEESNQSKGDRKSTSR